MNKQLEFKQRIFGLDVVRAIAIILVLFSHVYYLMDIHHPSIIALSGLLGFTGVELFFVLSGFLIGSILLKNYVEHNFTKKDLFVFLKRRWFRTLPAYYLVLLLNIVLALYMGYSLENVWRYFFFLQNFSAYYITIFSESWSLSIEEFTYILAPLFLFIIGKIWNYNRKISFLVCTLLLLLFFNSVRYFYYLNSSINDMDQWNTQLKLIVIYRADAIVIGFLVAWIHYYYGEFLKKYSVYLFIVAAHLYFLQFVVFNVYGFDIHTQPLYFRVLYFTLSGLTFAIGLPAFIYWDKSSFKVSKIITYISKLSYSMYLLHYSIITVLIKKMMKEGVLIVPGYLVVLIYFLATLFFSYLLYYFYERPVTQLRDK
ncbi:conserved membrane hypothetical protein [Flavobacterium sp. 9AF]|uniref:acyltransferase family protein n=1 Tax=Flavobacterium sp. 9AF TaxID=2653142 RepID=UPI0012EFFA97|nr:acyltransferase [Flavobacterium sp. 9AF]VXC32861.1 conserved membrane hypothetical protein [Flavobacterium sp. 9AF]